MIKEDIIRMARESDLWLTSDERIAAVERFASLVIAAEREACAKVCEDNATDLSEGDWDSACTNCADHIRARNKT